MTRPASHRPRRPRLELVSTDPKLLLSGRHARNSLGSNVLQWEPWSTENCRLCVAARSSSSRTTSRPAICSERLLELLGARVFVAGNGLDGLERLASHLRCDAVLCDLTMPIMRRTRVRAPSQAKPAVSPHPPGRRDRAARAGRLPADLGRRIRRASGEARHRGDAAVVRAPLLLAVRGKRRPGPSALDARASHG